MVTFLDIMQLNRQPGGALGRYRRQPQQPQQPQSLSTIIPQQQAAGNLPPNGVLRNPFSQPQTARSPGYGAYGSGGGFFAQIVDGGVIGSPDHDGSNSDWFAPQGTLVRTPVSGTVVNVGSGFFGGVGLAIRGDDGGLWEFRHGSGTVQPGMRVEAGQPVFRIGDGSLPPGWQHVDIRLNGQGATQLLRARGARAQTMPTGGPSQGMGFLMRPGPLAGDGAYGGGMGGPFGGFGPPGMGDPFGGLFGGGGFPGIGGPPLGGMGGIGGPPLGLPGLPGLGGMGGSPFGGGPLFGGGLPRMPGMGMPMMPPTLPPMGGLPGLGMPMGLPMMGFPFGMRGPF